MCRELQSRKHVKVLLSLVHAQMIRVRWAAQSPSIGYSIQIPDHPRLEDLRIDFICFLNNRKWRAGVICNDWSLRQMELLHGAQRWDRWAMRCSPDCRYKARTRLQRTAGREHLGEKQQLVRKELSNALLLRGKPGLREVMLQMLDAPQRHDTLPLRCAPAERLLGLVRRVHVRVESGLSAGFLHGARCRGSSWKLKCVIELALRTRCTWWRRRT